MHLILPYFQYFSWFVIYYFLTINLIYLILVIISYFHIRSQLWKKKVYTLSGLYKSELYKPISIIAPAFNEEANIITSITSLLQLQFPDFEVVVVNDGSTDRTLSLLMDQFKLIPDDKIVAEVIPHKPIKQIYKSETHPNLIVVDKENGRKADSMNAGLNVAEKELVCMIDADSILESDVLLKLLEAFSEDERTIAVGGIIRAANGCTIENSMVKKVGMPRNFLARIQVVEYLRAFLFGRVGWDYLNSLLIISGAFGVFDREAVITVGGFLHDTIGEDMEMVVRLHRYYREHKLPYRIRFLPEPVCWTEVPESWEVLGKQRNRWQRGLTDTMMRHKKMLFNPKYGVIGMLAMPFFFFFEMLGPVIELIGFIYFFVQLIMGHMNSAFVIMFFGVAILLGMILSISSILCEEFTFHRFPNVKDVFIMSFHAFFENIGYRQIHTWWRFRGIIDYFNGNLEWGDMAKKGFGNKQPKPHKAIWERIKDLRYWSVIGLVMFLVGLLLYHFVQQVIATGSLSKVIGL